jgi:hypothetical protein
MGRKTSTRPGDRSAWKHLGWNLPFEACMSFGKAKDNARGDTQEFFCYVVIDTKCW